MGGVLNQFILYSGWLIGVLGLGLTLILYRRSRLVKRLELRQLSTSTIKFPADPQDHQILFDGKSVGQSITCIQCSLRNTGNTGLDKSDLRMGDASIEIETNSGEIVGAFIESGKIEPRTEGISF